MSSAAFHIKMVNELPEKFVVNMIKEAIQNHELLNTENSREHLLQSCSTLLLKDVIKRDGVESTIKQIDQVGSLNNFFKTNKN